MHNDKMVHLIVYFDIADYHIDVSAYSTRDAALTNIEKYMRELISLNYDDESIIADKQRDLDGRIIFFETDSGDQVFYRAEKLWEG